MMPFLLCTNKNCALSYKVENLPSAGTSLPACKKRNLVLHMISYTFWRKMDRQSKTMLRELSHLHRGTFVLLMAKSERECLCFFHWRLNVYTQFLWTCSADKLQHETTSGCHSARLMMSCSHLKHVMIHHAPGTHVVLHADTCDCWYDKALVAAIGVVKNVSARQWLWWN